MMTHRATFKISEAPEFAGVSADTFHEWVEQVGLQSYALGRSRMFFVKDYDEKLRQFPYPSDQQSGGKLRGRKRLKK